LCNNYVKYTYNGKYSEVFFTGNIQNPGHDYSIPRVLTVFKESGEVFFIKITIMAGEEPLLDNFLP
jgi:hypothetical protein